MSFCICVIDFSFLNALTSFPSPCSATESPTLRSNLLCFLNTQDTAGAQQLGTRSICLRVIEGMNEYYSSFPDKYTAWRTGHTQHQTSRKQSIFESANDLTSVTCHLLHYWRSLLPRQQLTFLSPKATVDVFSSRKLLVFLCGTEQKKMWC